MIAYLIAHPIGYPIRCHRDSANRPRIAPIGSVRFGSFLPNPVIHRTSPRPRIEVYE